MTRQRGRKRSGSSSGGSGDDGFGRVSGGLSRSSSRQPKKSKPVSGSGSGPGTAPGSPPGAGDVTSDMVVGATRDKFEKVKTARRRKSSSTRWLQRQLNDPYVAEARRLGFRSRAAFKLTQIDDRFGFLKPGAVVVDLGAAPGGWTQVAVQRTRAEVTDPHTADGKKAGRVVGIDILEWDPVPGAMTLMGDFLDPDAPMRLAEALSGRAPDVVLSDMAAATTGHRPTDHIRTIALAEAAWQFAEETLAPGGSFVCKVFQGGAEKTLLEAVKRHCSLVRHVKPPASRPESPEVYLVASGFNRH